MKGKNIITLCYENGHDNLCRQLTEEFSLRHLINQKNKVKKDFFLSINSNYRKETIYLL